MELLIAPLHADPIHHHLPILVAVHHQLSQIQVEVSIPAFQVLQVPQAHRALQAIQVVEIIIIQGTIQMQAEIQAHQIHTIQIHTATETETHTADATHMLETKTRTLAHLVSVDFSAICSVAVVVVVAVVAVAAAAIDTEAADQMDSIMETFSMLYLVVVATVAVAQVCYYY